MTSILNKLKTWETWLTVLVGALIGIATSHFYYRLGLVEARPAFVVDPQRALVVERARLADAPVRVVRADGQPINKDVSAIHAYFWNAGNKPILPADVLDPLRLSVPPDTEILDFKITKWGRGAVTHANAVRVSTTDLQIAFRVLEENDGFAIQLLIAGEPRDIRLSGTIIGVRHIDTNATIVERTASWVIAVIAVIPFAVLIMQITSRFSFGTALSPQQKTLVQMTRGLEITPEQYEPVKDQLLTALSDALARQRSRWERFLGLAIPFVLCFAAVAFMIWSIQEHRLSASEVALEAVPSSLRDTIQTR